MSMSMSNETILFAPDVKYRRISWQAGHSGVADGAGLLDRVHQRRVRRPFDHEQVHRRAEGQDDAERRHLQVAGGRYQH